MKPLSLVLLVDSHLFITKRRWSSVTVLAIVMLAFSDDVDGSLFFIP